MTEQLKFEVNKQYRTRDGRKATVLLIRPRYVFGEVEGKDNPVVWSACGGCYNDPIPCGCDLVAEWREPARVMVRVYRNTKSDVIRVLHDTILVGNWQLIAQREITEGEGME